MSIFSYKNSRAFTLIEIIVSMALFSIVAVVALAALVKIVSANKKAQTLQSAISNLNYALESMSREMRTGTAYNCDPNNFTMKGADVEPNGCGDGSSVVFRSSKTRNVAPADPALCNLAIAYRFRQIDGAPDGQFTLEKSQQDLCDGTVSDSGFTSVIDPSVVITNWKLMVTDVPPNFPYQKAVIFIDGYVGTKEKEKTVFSVQTAVSARTEQ